MFVRYKEQHDIIALMTEKGAIGRSVQYITNHRQFRKKRIFKVRWKGVPGYLADWMSEDEVKKVCGGSKALKEYYEGE